MKKTKLTTRQKVSRKINRKRAVRKWWQTTTRRVVLASVMTGVLICATGGWWFSHTGKLDQMTSAWGHRVWMQTARMGFKVENIYLEGRNFTPLPVATKAIGVVPGDPILALSLDDMRTRLQAIPQVKYAEVVRVLPNQLHVHIVERTPVAVWQNQSKLHLIDQDGIVMEYVDPAEYKQLLLVVGDDAPAHTQDLMKTLALQPELYKDVTCAVRVGDRRWNIRFKNGLELKLPEHNTSEAWDSFARMEHEHHLFARPIKTVDMRLSDRIFIKAAPEESKPSKDGGSET